MAPFSSGCELHSSGTRLGGSGVGWGRGGNHICAAHLLQLFTAVQAKYRLCINRNLNLLPAHVLVSVQVHSASCLHHSVSVLMWWF